MRPMHNVWMFLSIVAWAGLAGAAETGAATPAAGAPAAPPSGAAATAPPLTDAEHWAKGEVLSGKDWVSMDDLFKDYQAAYAEKQTLLESGKSARDGLIEMQRQINLARQVNLDKARVIRAEIANDKKAVKDTQIALLARPPQMPAGGRDLPYPNRNNYQNDGDYNNAVRNWQGQNAQHQIAYDAAVAQYNKDLAAFKQRQEDLKKKLPGLQDVVKQAEAKLKQHEADARTQMIGLNDQQKTANEQAQAAGQKVTLQDARIESLAAALRTAPETVRFKHGIVEWEGALSALANLEKLLSSLDGEIARVRDKLAAEAKATGHELPITWEHPQQKRLDALKTLIKQVKAVQAAK